MVKNDAVRRETSLRYIAISREALSQVKLATPERTFLREMGEDFLSMARNYFDDAMHFHESGDYERALAAVNYAHGWLDAGARIGLFDVDSNDRLFTLYK